MDLNIKIIEGVRQFPSLHDNCGNLDERNLAWSQLAEKLNMHVQVLKIRWHALLQLYQRDVNFKYANIMNFVCRNAERKTKKDNWPEFIITEEYLKYDNNGDQEQFIFLETEDRDNAKISKCKENDCNFSEMHKNVKEIPDKDCKNEEKNISEKANVVDEVGTSSKQNQMQDEDIEIVFPLKSQERDISFVKEKMATVDVSKNNSRCFMEAKQEPVIKPQPAIVERCEDVIFGELVSAMLKRMDENKKKSIKKEIMNILFS